MMLVDSHCHLDKLDPREAGGLDQALATAKEAGVERFFSIAVSPAEWDELARTAATYEEISVALGVHPK